MAVNDHNGCSVSINNTAIIQPAKIVFTGVLVVDIETSPVSPGSINLSVTGGTPAYAYAWLGPTGNASTQDLTNISDSGTYSVHVVGSKGCIGDTSVLINDAIMMAYIQSKQDINCHGGKWKRCRWCK